MGVEFLRSNGRLGRCGFGYSAFCVLVLVLRRVRRCWIIMGAGGGRSTERCFKQIDGWGEISVRAGEHWISR